MKRTASTEEATEGRSSFPEKSEQDEDCPECEVNLKEQLVSVACRYVTGDERKHCEALVDEYISDNDEITPEGFVEHMKRNSAWQGERDEE